MIDLMRMTLRDPLAGFRVLKAKPWQPGDRWALIFATAACSAILSWLVAFNVVNTRNQFVSAVAEFLYRITEPVLRPIRNVMPNLGGLDISPIIVILIIMFIQRVIAYYIYPNVI